MSTKIPTLTPTGSWAISLYAMVDLIAASATFQSIVGASTTAAARAFVSVETDDSPDTTEYRPRAIVRYANEYTRTKLSPASFLVAGNFLVSFEFPPTPKYLADDNRWDQMIEFLNRVDAIFLEMGNAGGITTSDYFAANTHIAFNSVTLQAGPDRCEDTPGVDGESQEVYWAAVFLIGWAGQ